MTDNTTIAIDGDDQLPALPAGVALQSRQQAFDDVVSRTADSGREIHTRSVAGRKPPMKSTERGP